MAGATNNIFLMDYALAPLFGTKIEKFMPVYSTEDKEGLPGKKMLTRGFAITMMNKYMNKSFEELRLEDEVLLNHLPQRIFIGQSQQRGQQMPTFEYKAGVFQVKFQNENFTTEQCSESLFSKPITPFASKNNNQSTTSFGQTGPTPNQNSFGAAATTPSTLSIKSNQPVFVFGKTNNTNIETQKETENIEIVDQSSSSNDTSVNANTISQETLLESINLNLYNPKPFQIKNHTNALTVEETLAFKLNFQESLDTFSSKNVASLKSQTDMNSKSNVESETNGLEMNKESTTVNNSPGTKCFNFVPQILHRTAISTRKKSLKAITMNKQKSCIEYNFTPFTIKHEEEIKPTNLNFNLPTIEPSIENNENTSNKSSIKWNIPSDMSAEEINDEDISRIADDEEYADGLNMSEDIPPHQTTRNYFQLVSMSIIGGFIVNTLLLTFDLNIENMSSILSRIIYFIITSADVMIIGIENLAAVSQNVIINMLGSFIASSLFIFSYGFLKNNYAGSRKKSYVICLIIVLVLLSMKIFYT